VNVAERVHGITFIRFTLNLVAERVHGITFIRFTLNLVAERVHGITCKPDEGYSMNPFCH
jgi:hypothetical protein